MEKIVMKNDLNVEVFYNGVPKVSNMHAEVLEMFSRCLEEKIYEHFQKAFKHKSKCPEKGTCK